MEDEIKDILNKEYKDSIDLNSGIKLGLKAMRKVQGKNFDITRLDVGVINNTDMKFRKLSVSDLNKIK